MNLQEFIESRKFLTLKNYDEEKVEGYSYATDTYPAPEHGENKFSRSHSDYCEEHHWIAKIPVSQLKKNPICTSAEDYIYIDIDGEQIGVTDDGYTYHLILCNADYLDSDLAKLEKMLYEFIYGSLGTPEEPLP